MTDSEKITINLNGVDLGRIDLLVQEGYYGNRADFIRTAIRNQLEKHADAVDHAATRKSMVIGTLAFSRKELEAHQQKQEKVNVKVIGMFLIADDVSPELALAVIDSATVMGVFKAPEAVKKALADRIS